MANIDLMRSSHDDLAGFLSEARQASCFMLTQDHRERLADTIKPESYSASELTQYFEEFNEQNDPNSGEGMLNSMSWLKACLGQIDANHVGFLMIG